MKEARWQAAFAWAGVAALIGLFNLHLALNPVPGVTNVGSVRVLLLFACVFALRNVIRGVRGFRDEEAYSDIDSRIRHLPAGDPRVEVVVDRFGKYLNAGMVTVEWALLSWSFAVRNDPVAHVAAVAAGVFAYVLLLGLVTDLRFPSHLIVSPEGVRCRWVSPEVDVRWEEIQSVRTKSRSSRVGQVYFTLTDAGLARLPDTRVRRMRRLAKRTGAHYRWADIFVWSSAGETARLLELLRTSPEARAAVARGMWLRDVVANPTSDLPAAPGRPAA